MSTGWEPNITRKNLSGRIFEMEKHVYIRTFIAIDAFALFSL